MNRPVHRCVIFVLLTSAALFGGQPSLEVVPESIGSAAELLSLPARIAGRRLPVRITGTVTAVEADWNGQFFLQDESGGVFVENFRLPAPSLGDRVEVRGASHPGAFAPIITAPDWKVLGQSPLPEARKVTIENLESGIEDGMRIEVSGVVRALKTENARLTIDLAVGGFRLQVFTRIPPEGNLQRLIASRVRVKGVAATQYNAQLRHLLAVAVYVPRLEDFIVEEHEKVNPFDKEAIPLNSVAQYRRDSSPGKRVHVVGTVIHYRPGSDIYLQDDSGGLRIHSTQSIALTPGDTVEAVGFLEFEDFLPLLQDGELRKVEKPRSPARARRVARSELLDGLHHAEYISLSGKIVDRASRAVERNGQKGMSTQWLIQGDGLNFTADFEDASENPALLAIPTGSIVEVSGVCLVEKGTDRRLKSLHLLLPSPGDMKVLETPPWLDTRRLIIGLAGVCGLLALAIAWLLTVSKKNAALSVLIKELEKTRNDLQEAHDTLEEKVKKRSAQLKVEITARKTNELQFKAILAERTRLARDLHDTLEQTLTGIALQLDTSSKLFERSPEDSKHHLQLARNWMRQSQIELRRSIWDLRSRELAQFDLPSALYRSAAQMVEGTTIRLETETLGEKRILPEIVEENVLRIGQEALTNIIKHANASSVKISLEFTPNALRLTIADNGCGFVAGPMPSPSDNHFGLLGMSERARRLAGGFQIDSAPGQGTKISIEIPLDPAAENLQEPPATESSDSGIDSSP